MAQAQAKRRRSTAGDFCRHSSVGVAALVIMLTAPLVAAKEKQFKRIQEFPAGRQTSEMAGMFLGGLKDVSVVEYTFDAPYGPTWLAAKRVARKLEQEGGRSLLGADERQGLIQNGKIKQDDLIGMGSLAWMDEFQIQVKKASDERTQVTVARKVVDKDLDSGKWKAAWSNSKIESWIFTQIEAEIPKLAQDAAEPEPATDMDYKKSAPGKYARSDRSEDHLDLKGDGTFFLTVNGKGLAGKYEVQSSELTLILPSGSASKARLRGDTILDDDGYKWIRVAGVPAPSVAEPATAPPTPSSSPAEALTNQDVIRMVQAKLPSSVIVTKIKKSAPKFDASADGLIALREAGAGDDVIQAIVDAGSK